MKCFLKNVRCEIFVLFLIECLFNRGVIGYVLSFLLKVVFFLFFLSYGDKVFCIFLGRFFVIVWMLFGFVMILFFLVDMINVFILYFLFKIINKKVYGVKVSLFYEL